MRYRMPVNKARSVRKFRKTAGRTKLVNVRPGYGRGGTRF